MLQGLAPIEAVLPRLHELSGKRVLVVGDIVLDRYVIGRATRLSREAPVPVLVHEESFALPGSAANPARNICALGSAAVQVGVVGDDDAGAELIGLLRAAGVDTGGVVRVPGRRTTVKQRVLARSALRYPQQLLRLDWLAEGPLPEDAISGLVLAVEALAPGADAILISDYQGGVANQAVLEACLSAKEKWGLPVCVDAQHNLWQYRGVDCVKCNREEVAAALGSPPLTEGDFRGAAGQILNRLGAGMVAITRGAEGMALQPRAGPYISVPAPNRTEVFDVVGAGDTVIAIITLGMIARWDPWVVATVAQLGAGIVIQKLGNATPTLEQLEEAANRWLQPGAASLR